MTEPLLVTAVKDPSSVTGLSKGQWNELIRQAERELLVARLYVGFEAAGLLDAIPERARHLLHDGLVQAEFNQTRIRFEVNRVSRALLEAPVPLLLLKGSAYLALDLPMARGRLAADLDIMVPHDRISQIRDALIAAGWTMAVTRAYDVHYYETWMHEIAPLWHPEREMATDVHHTITPPTSRVSPKVEALWAAARETETGHKALCPADMVLHAAVHLINEDFRMGFRDLVDLHDLLIQFGGEAAFWSELEARAELHELGRVYYYLLGFTTALLDTPVPQANRDSAERFAPPAPIALLMDWLGRTALTPRLRHRQGWIAKVAFACLYIRSHWLRMPPLLLLRHLSIKAWFRVREAVPGVSAG